MEFPRKISKFYDKGPQQDRNGRQWANLCIQHEKELADSIGQDAKEILRCWIRAGGGAKKMAERMI